MAQVRFRAHFCSNFDYDIHKCRLFDCDIIPCIRLPCACGITMVWHPKLITTLLLHHHVKLVVVTVILSLPHTRIVLRIWVHF